MFSFKKQKQVFIFSLLTAVFCSKKLAIGRKIGLLFCPAQGGCSHLSPRAHTRMI